MGKKTVIKRLVKLLPASVEVAKAVEIDNAVETRGMASTDETILDGELLGTDTLGAGQTEAKPTRSAALAEKVSKDKPKAENPKDDPAKAQDAKLPATSTTFVKHKDAPQPGGQAPPDDELPWPTDEHGAATEPAPTEQPKVKPATPMSAARVNFLTTAAQAQNIPPVYLTEAIAGLPLLPLAEQKAFLDAVGAGNVGVWNRWEPKVGGAK